MNNMKEDNNITPRPNLSEHITEPFTKESRQIDINSIDNNDDIDNSSENPLQKLREFSQSTKSKLLNLRKTLKSVIKEHKIIMHDKYSKYEYEINNFISNEGNKITSKYSSLDDPKLIDGVNNLIEKINSIIKLHEFIQESIIENFKLINKLFLSTKDIITLNSPIEIFLTKNMDSFINSWSLLKLNGDLSLNSSNNFLNNLLKDQPTSPSLQGIFNFSKINNNFNLEINSKDEINNELINKVTNNIKRLTEVSICNVHNEDYFKLISCKKNRSGSTPKSEQYDGVCKIQLKNGNFDQVSFYDYFPNVEQIYLKNIFINPEILFSGKKTLNKLKELYLINLNLTSISFEKIIKCLYNNSELLENLEILSVKHNKISKPCLVKDDQESTGEEFKNLNELDFEDNNIFKYDLSNFSSTPKLRFINLSNNNISSPDSFYTIQKGFNHLEKFKKEKLQKENCEYIPQKHLVLVAKNLFINKTKERNNYINYIKDVLVDFDYPIKNLHFEYIFTLQNIHLINEFKLSEIIMLNLQYLNLSTCSLKNENLIQFFINCKGLFKLKKIILCNNLLDENFFKLYLDNNIMSVFIKVEEFDFSGNQLINANNNNFIEKFIEFANANKTLKKIRMMKTSLELIMDSFVKCKFNQKYSNYTVNDKIKYIYGYVNNFYQCYKDNNTSCLIVIRRLLSDKIFDEMKSDIEKELGPFMLKDNLIKSHISFN